MTTTTRLSALALALAAFTTATFLAGSSAPAGTGLVFKRPLPPGATSVIGTTNPAPTPAPAGGLISKLPPGELNQLLTKQLPPHGIGQICPLNTGGCPPIPRPPAMGHGPWVPPWDRGWGRDRDHDYGYGYGYDRDRYFHRFAWRFAPPIVVEGGPEAGPAPMMQGAPARMPVAAPSQPTAAPQSAPAPQAMGEPCNCLTKQTLPDGSVLFQDICTKESAIAPPTNVSAR